MLRSKRLENDVVVLFVHDSARALVDFKIFSKPPGYHHLSFYGEHHGVSSRCWIHNRKYYSSDKSKSKELLLESYYIVSLFVAKFSLSLHRFSSSVFVLL